VWVRVKVERRVERRRVEVEVGRSMVCWCWVELRERWGRTSGEWEKEERLHRRNGFCTLPAKQPASERLSFESGRRRKKVGGGEKAGRKLVEKRIGRREGGGEGGWEWNGAVEGIEGVSRLVEKTRREREGAPWRRLPASTTSKSTRGRQKEEQPKPGR
jgi:hypothetical protein